MSTPTLPMRPADLRFGQQRLTAADGSEEFMQCEHAVSAF
jgi:hypothetical protein